MIRILLSGSLIIGAMTCCISDAQSKESKEDTKETKIARAMAAGSRSTSSNAIRSNSHAAATTASALPTSQILYRITGLPGACSAANVSNLLAMPDA